MDSTPISRISVQCRVASKFDKKHNNLTLLSTPSLPNNSIGGGDIDFDKHLLVFPVHEGEIGIYNIEQQKMLTFIKINGRGVYRAIFSHDKKTILAGTQNGVIGKWRVDDFTLESTIDLNLIT